MDCVFIGGPFDGRVVPVWGAGREILIDDKFKYSPFNFYNALDSRIEIAYHADGCRPDMVAFYGGPYDGKEVLINKNIASVQVIEKTTATTYVRATRLRGNGNIEVGFDIVANKRAADVDEKISNVREALDDLTSNLLTAIDDIHDMLDEITPPRHPDTPPETD